MDLNKIPLKKIDGSTTDLSAYDHQVLLVVNVASKCGLTPQYQQLEELYQKYKAQGFSILGFPANDFGSQEPGTNAEIQEFCSLTYGVDFPMFEKIQVLGTGQHPLYATLTSLAPVAKKHDSSFEEKLKGYGITRAHSQDILWNFEKFLIGKDGNVIARFSPDITPQDPILLNALELALK